MEVLLIGNDLILELTGVQDEISEAYINDATVTATVKTIDGEEVSGQSWPLPLDYVAGSDGDYRGNLEDSLVLSPSTMYDVEVSADCGNDMILYINRRVQARYRTS